MAKRSSAVPDSFEVDVVSLLRGQVDAIVHELAVAISDIQSGFPEEEAEDYLYGKLEDLVPAMREQSARLREQHQRELKRHLRNEPTWLSAVRWLDRNSGPTMPLAEETSLNACLRGLRSGPRRFRSGPFWSRG
jgi:hypothetical protein